MRLRTVLVLGVAVTLAAPASALADFAHVVTPGETLTAVAAADGLTVDQVAAANGLPADASLIAGSTLLIPPQSGPAPSAAATGPTTVSASSPVAASQGPAASYVVQPGDTLSAIAARAGMSVESLAAANGLDPNGVLLSGSVLQLAGGAPSAPSGVADASGQPVGAPAEGTPGAPPYPTPESVSASDVASIASANGVSPSLADAIGWQESGFNNDLISSAGAVGVMQILPGTWDWIQRSLTAGTALSPSSAADNVRGGVLMLHALLNSTGGDPTLAAAGYYQGLSSVQANGMYADTQQYVNNVMALRQQFGGP